MKGIIQAASSSFKQEKMTLKMEGLVIRTCIRLVLWLLDSL